GSRAALCARAGAARDRRALYAFRGGAGGVRGRVPEPLAGEVRLQYWHDLIDGAGEPGANPVALAFLRSGSRPTSMQLRLPTGLSVRSPRPKPGAPWRARQAARKRL